MALFHREETNDQWRRRIFAEAEELLRNHPGPPMEEVLARARRLRKSLPKNLNLTDSVELLREARER
jgi:hypothetical protein